MYPSLSQYFIPALNTHHSHFPRMEAWYNGSILPGAEDIPILGGEVNVQSGTGVHRTLDCTIPKEYWELFDLVGIELKPYWVMRYLDRTEEAIPLGVFQVEEDNLSVGFGGEIELSSCPDRWNAVKRARFPVPRQSTVSGASIGEARQQAGALMTQAINTPISITATSSYKPPLLTWEKDRDQAIIDMLASIGAEAFYDWTGQAVVRDRPKLSNTPVWTVKHGEGGVFIGGNLKRSRQQTYNVVVIYSTAANGALFTTQVVKDTDINSPTYIGRPGLGEIVYFMPNPVINSNAQALLAAQTRLNQVKSKVSQLTIKSQAVNPALGEGDVVLVELGNGLVQRHIADSFNIPLTVEGGNQTILTRSSRPEGEVPGSE